MATEFSVRGDSRRQLSPADVTACLVTRGDQPEMLQRILESLIFENVVVWDNHMVHDHKVAGRYYAVLQAPTTVVYFQDDDVLVPAETQQALVDSYLPGVMVANWAHGDNPDGYEDIPLVGAGAIVDADLPWKAIDRWAKVFPLDEAFAYEADFIIGALYDEWTQVRLPFEIVMEIAQHPSRLVNQPWQKNLKLKMTNKARALRAT